MWRLVEPKIDPCIDSRGQYPIEILAYSTSRDVGQTYKVMVKQTLDGSVVAPVGFQHGVNKSPGTNWFVG